MRWPWQSSSAKERRPRRRWLIAIVGVLLFLLLMRLVAPTVIEKVVEATLANMPDGYRATVEDVDIRGFATEVALVGLRIEKKNGKVPVPFIHAKEMVLSVVRDSWKPRSALRMVQPVISYVDAESKELQQKGPKFDPANLRKQLPFELISVHIEDAEIHVRNYQTKPDLDFVLSHVNLAWNELVGCLPPGSPSCRSTLQLDGDVGKSGKLTAEGAFARDPGVRFDLRAKLRDLRAAELTPLLRHYAKIGIEKGEIGLDATYGRRNDAHRARIVPRFKDLDVLGEIGEGTRFVRQLGVAAAAGWLERKSGQKAIELRSTPSGSMDYTVVDLDEKKKDREDDE